MVAFRVAVGRFSGSAQPASGGLRSASSGHSRPPMLSAAWRVSGSVGSV